MITRQTTSQDTLVTSNFSTFETTDMRIVSERGMAFALDLISNRLYSDKILAVVRELCCNALDEHKKHNITRPIEVTLDETAFTVTDFARGLSKEDTQNIFGNFFESTKGGTNDLIGGFGIGAKAPFAYTDNWYVTSHHNGTAYEFLCAKIRKDGFTKPQMTLINSYPSDVTGIKVVVPLVNKGDKYAFDNSFTSFSNSLKSTVCFNGKTIVPRERKQRTEVDLLRGTKGAYYRAYGWTAYENNQSQSFGNNYTRWAGEYDNGIVTLNIGEVAYTFSLKNILNRDEFNSKERTFRWFVLNHIFEAPIGEITISPNRETIEFDTPTFAALSSLLNSAYADFLADVQNIANSVKDTKGLQTFINVYGRGFFFEFVKLPALKATFRGYHKPTSKHVNFFYEEKDTVKDYTNVFIGGQMGERKYVINDLGNAEIQQRVHQDKLTELLDSPTPEHVLFLTPEEAARIESHDFLAPHFISLGKYSDLLAAYDAKKTAEPKRERAKGVRRKGLVTYIVPSTRSDKGYVQNRIASEAINSDALVVSVDDEAVDMKTPGFVKRIEAISSYFAREFGKNIYVCIRAPKDFEFDVLKEEYVALFTTPERRDSIRYAEIAAKEVTGDMRHFETIVSRHYPTFATEYGDNFFNGKNGVKRLAELDALAPEVETFVQDAIASTAGIIAFYEDFAKKNNTELVHSVYEAEAQREYLSHYSKAAIFDALIEKNPNFIEELKKHFIKL